MRRRIFITTKNVGISIIILKELHKKYCLEKNIPFWDLCLSVFNPLSYIYIFLLRLFTKSDIIFFGPLYFHSFFVRKSYLIFHDLTSLQKSRYYGIIKKIYYFCFKNNVVLPVSNLTRNYLVDNFGHLNQIVLHNPNRFENSNFRRVCAPVRNDKLVNILVFNQTENKNFNYIIRNLQPKSNLCLKIIGVYNIQMFSEDLRNKGFNFTFYDKIDDHKLVEIYQNSTLLLFLSTSEGFGLPLIEAQHFGIPVLASNLSIFKDEILLDSGLYLDLNERKCLNDSISTIMGNYSEYVNKSLTNALRFSLNNYFDKFNSILANELQ